MGKYVGRRLERMVEHLREVVRRQPLAAAVGAQVLRCSLSLPFEQAQLLESLAYSMLLGSEPFRAWRAATPVRELTGDDGPRVLLSREAGLLSIRLNRPRACNAVDARMRDSLVEALQFALDDPEIAPILISGAGPVFCASGDLNEFGQAADPGMAHLIRVLRAPVRLIHQMRARVRAPLQGACIGAGIEMPAAAGSVTATPEAFFRLPEIGMGLIPGAGGTTSIPRRLGRHRCCLMMISGSDIDANTALSWGLVDSLELLPA